MTAPLETQLRQAILVETGDPTLDKAGVVAGA